MALTDYYSLIAQLAQDSASRLTADDVDTAVRAAVLRYSKDRPRRIVEDLTAATGGQYLDLPVDWQAGFSAVQELEYPIGQVPRSLIPAGAEGWELLPMPDGSDLVALAAGLPAGATVRLSYTRRHVLTAGQDTLPEDDREAVCCWAAAILCDQLAAWYAANGDPTIQADRVDQTSPQKAYAAQAKMLRKRYQDEIGVEEKRNVAAGTVVSHPDRNSLGGVRITHPIRGWTGQR